MKKVIFILLNVVVFWQFGYTQKYTISGYVEDLQTNEKLINAKVFIKNTNKATISNDYGYYNLSFEYSDSLVVVASYLGYKSKEILITSKKNQEINFHLEANNEIGEVVVTATTPINKSTEMGVMEIPIKQLNLIPAVGAEPDIMKAYQLMPGVQAGNEGNAGLFVRGGGSDQNLILLDDVPLYNVGHIGGFVSVFNSDIIKKVKLTKGGFPARYGGRLSSVMDIRTKDGNVKKIRGKVNLGLVSSKIYLEGPLKKDKSSFVVSARILSLGLLWKPLKILFMANAMEYYFWDLNAKWNYKINEKNHIYYSFYYGDDKLKMNFGGSEEIKKYRDKLITQWGNLLNAFRWNHEFNQKLFLNTTLATTRYRYKNIFKIPDENSFYKSHFSTAINDYFLKFDFEYNVNNSYDIRFGTNAIYHNFLPKKNKVEFIEDGLYTVDTTYGDSKITPWEFRIYCENRFNVSKYFSANIGVHSSYYALPDTNYFSLEPRVLLNISLAKNLSLKTSYASMMQKVHLLSSNTLALPMDIWLPTTKKILPSKTNLYSAGLFFSLKKSLLEFSVEGYYKTSNNLISFKEGARYSTVTSDFSEKLELDGIGKSYGLELLLQKKQGHLTGWLSYTYSKTDLQFSNLNFGKPFPFKYDRRHDFSIVLNYKLNEKFNFSANWVYGSGYPYSLAVAHYNGVGTGNEGLVNYDQNILLYSDRNLYRMRAYHRLDLGFNYTKKEKNKIKTWTFSIYNAYNRQNPYFYYTSTEEDNGYNEKLYLYQQSLFPIIPSVSYSVKF